MICPYNRMATKQVIQTSYTLDDSGNTTMTDQVVVEHHTLMECPEEGCGAWQDGKCNYKGE